MHRATSRALLGLASLLAVASCRTGETGEEGRLRFSFASGDPLGDLGRPIAVGARLDLRVEDPSTLVPMTIGGATSDDPSILEVVALEDATLVLRGMSPGRARVSVTAMHDGEIVGDSIELSVARAGHLELSTGCPGGEEGVYLASSRISIPYELSSDDGEALIGYGLAPVQLDPPSALALDATSRSMEELELRTGTDAARATITSTLDATRLALDIVPESDLDDARLRLGPLGDRVDLRATRFVLVQALASGRALCQGAPSMEVIEETQAICSAIVVRELRTDDDTPRTYGWLQITGRAQGVCRFRVRYPVADLEVPFALSVR